MNTKKLSTCFLGAAMAIGASMMGTDAKSDPAIPGGMTAVYGGGQGPIMPNSTEFISTESAIISMAASGSPMAIWQTLEHGEEVNCLDCIGAVAPLLFDANAKNREISAWWLRRRMLGVFGPGQVYEQTLNTLATDSSPTRRAYAASAIGEFLHSAGIAPLAAATVSDSDPGVRAAAASALGRLNDDGSSSGTTYPAALTKALADSDSGVKVAALEAAGRVSSLGDPAFTTALAGMVGDSDPMVRTHAVQLMDEMRLSSAFAGVLALAKGDSDDGVRLAACHAIGSFGASLSGSDSSSAQATLTFIAQNDSNTRVRDMANIALLML
jgi:hypothetical protein